MGHEGQPTPPDPARGLIELIDRFPSRRITVIGDLVADEFIYGRVARVSREAPVLILEYDTTIVLPGGAGNAANNAASLGSPTWIIAVAGRDEAGTRVLEAFDAGVDRRGVLRVADLRTPTKTRILAGGIHSAKQQVVRIDRAVDGRIGRDVREALMDRAEDAVSRSDAILISDYGLGSVTSRLVSRVKRAAGAAGRHVPVLIDTRHGLGRHHGLTACTPNESEVEHLLSVRIADDVRRLERAGREILDRTRMDAVLVTRGSRGMALFEPGRPTLHIPIFGSDEVADVTGAGDTVIATMTVAVAAGATFAEAARLANYAGGLVVMKRGTATVSADELRDAVQRDSAASAIGDR